MWDALTGGSRILGLLAIGGVAVAGALFVAAWCVFGAWVAAMVELSRGREHEP